MSLRLKKRICERCDNEARLRCSICSKEFCEQHCKSYVRHDPALRRWYLSLKFCGDCEVKLHQSSLGAVLASIEIDPIIRYG